MNLKNKMFSALLAGCMGLAMVTPVMAQGVVDPNFTTTVPEISKTIDFKGAQDAITLKNTAVSFNFEALNGGPAISTKTVTFENDKKTESKSVAALIQGEVDTFLGLAPGEYTYKLTEADVTSVTDGMAKDTTEYQFKVVVKNINAEKPEEGKFLEYTIVKGSKKTDKAEFTNVYTPKTSVDIKKVVTGAYGNKDKAFAFTVTLNFPYEYDTEFDNDKVLAKTEKIQFDLIHNETKTLTKLPAGTTITVSENADDHKFVEAKFDDVKFDLTETKTLNYTMNEKTTHSVVVTNEKGSDITPTGIIMNNLPFILLVVLGTAGIGFYLASKRRMN